MNLTALFSFCLLMGSFACQASTFLVTTNADAGPGSLRQALIEANAAGGGTIEFSNVIGAIELQTGELVIDSPVEIIGPGKNDLAISGMLSSRVFNLTTNGNAAISHLSLVNSRAPLSEGGGAIYNRGVLELFSCNVISNSTSFNAEHDSATGGPASSGGGIFNLGVLRITECRFEGNYCGVGVGNQPGLPGGSGGALYNYGEVLFIRSTIWGNSAGAGGNALYSSGGDGGLGGGIYNSGTLVMISSTLASNSCGIGGNGARDPGQAIGGFRGGSGGSGGGIYNAGVAVLTNCTVSGNSASRGGNGGNGRPPSPPVPAGLGGPGGHGGSGGGIYSVTNLVVGNSTLPFNSTGPGGNGGVGGSGQLPDENGLPGGPGSGGGVFSQEAELQLFSSLVAHNNGGDAAGTVVSLGYNLLTSREGGTGFTEPTDITGIDPLLGPLSENGGSTFTHALLPESPAIDRGSSGGLLMDQRDLPRTADQHRVENSHDGTDIGAFEFNSPCPIISDGGTLVLDGVSTNVLCDVDVGTIVDQSMLAITNGGSLWNIGNGNVGVTTGSESNAVVVTGPDSVWTMTNLNVGVSGSFNNMLISNGGRVMAMQGSVGLNSNANHNQVTVTGAGSMWTNTIVYVGKSGSSNSLFITNGGRGAGAFALIGAVQGANGNRVVMEGPDTHWTNSQTIYVGDGGSFNRLLITNGATTLSGSGHIGASGSYNLVAVIGVGSLWGARSALHVGLSGSFNALEIENGARVTNGLTFIGGTEGATGNAIKVSGSNSLWRPGSLLVGLNSSSNALTISDAGTVQAANALVGWSSSPSAHASDNLLNVSRGTLILTNADGTAGLTVWGGTLAFDHGVIIVDQMSLSNAPDFKFNAGQLSIRSSTLAKGVFTIGNGFDVASFDIRGDGPHAFENGLLIRPNGDVKAISSSPINAPAGVVIQTGGSLLYQLPDQLASGTPLMFSGGKLELGGHDQSAPLGSLTVRATSTIDFGLGGSQTLEFSGLAGHVSGSQLLITNWHGDPINGDGEDRLHITSGSSLTAVFLDQIHFVGYPRGAVLLASGELVPFRDGDCKPTLDATTSGGGEIHAEPLFAPYPCGTRVTLTAVAAVNWTFLGWLGDASGTNSEAELVMDRNNCVQAVFGTTLNTAVVGAGSIIQDPPSNLLPHGTRVRLTAVPESGQYFAGWTDPPGLLANPRTYAHENASQTLAASFAPLNPGQFALTIIPEGRGRVFTFAATNRYDAGKVVTSIAIPQPGQEFLGWAGQTNGAEMVNTEIRFPMDFSRIIQAKFTKNPLLEIAPCSRDWSKEEIQILISGEFGAVYEVLGSNDLATWTSLTTVTNTYGVVQFTDIHEEMDDQKFYRAREQ